MPYDGIGPQWVNQLSMASETGFNFQNIIFTDIFFNQIAGIVF